MRRSFIALGVCAALTCAVSTRAHADDAINGAIFSGFIGAPTHF